MSSGTERFQMTSRHPDQRIDPTTDDERDWYVATTVHNTQNGTTDRKDGLRL